MSNNRPHKISPEKAIFIEGFSTGFFLAIAMKTGISVDPFDLMISVIQKTEELTRYRGNAWNSPSLVPLASFLITILSILALIVTIFSVKNKIFGVMIFVFGLICGFGLIFYAYRK
jgi:hypothetical protein